MHVVHDIKISVRGKIERQRRTGSKTERTRLDCGVGNTKARVFADGNGVQLGRPRRFFVGWRERHGASADRLDGRDIRESRLHRNRVLSRLVEAVPRVKRQVSAERAISVCPTFRVPVAPGTEQKVIMKMRLAVLDIHNPAATEVESGNVNVRRGGVTYHKSICVNPSVAGQAYRSESSKSDKPRTFNRCSRRVRGEYVSVERMFGVCIEKERTGMAYA